MKFFEEGKGKGININKLDDLMMHTQIKTINRNGIRFLKADYYNEALYGLQGRVIIKYSLSDLTKIKIFTLKNEFICEAEKNYSNSSCGGISWKYKGSARVKIQD